MQNHQRPPLSRKPAALEDKGEFGTDDKRPLHDRSTEIAQRSDAEPREGAVSPEDSSVVRSFAEALGAPVQGARQQADELDRMRARGLKPDTEDGEDRDKVIDRHDHRHNTMTTAKELSGSHDLSQPPQSEATPRQANPDAAALPKQFREEQDEKRKRGELQEQTEHN